MLRERSGSIGVASFHCRAERREHLGVRPEKSCSGLVPNVQRRSDAGVSVPNALNVGFVFKARSRAGPIWVRAQIRRVPNFPIQPQADPTCSTSRKS